MAFGKLFVDLALRDKGFSASLKKAGGSVKQFEGTVNGLNKVVGGTLVKSFKAGTLAISAFGVASAKIGSDFEHSITLVKSLSKDGIENFAALTDEARRLGATTEFSARQSAEAMTNFARAGMDARQIIAATGPALMLAGGAGESMSLATLTMAASLRQFSLDASQSQHVADVFTLALKNSLFNLQGLNDAMKYAGPAGAAFGMSVEETTAAVAQFRNMGLDASMAGTAFRMSMVALAKQTPAMTKVMEKYGITSEQVSVTNLGFAKVLNNLADAGITAEDAIKMFGARAGANMGLLIEQMRKPEMRQGFKDLTADLYASSQGAGAAKEQYDEMGKTVQRQFLIAKSAFEELLITTFDTYKADLADFFAALGEVLQATADTFRGLSVAGGGFNNVLQASTQFLRENKSEIAQFFIDVFNGVQKTLEVVLALTPLVKLLAEAFLTAFPTLAVASFAIAITSLKAAFTVATAAAASFGVTLNIALGPIGLVAVGITAAITALVKLDRALQDTEGAAKRYNAEIERIAAQHKGWASQTSKLHGKTIALQQENFEKHAEYMKSLGASEAQIERYRQRLEALTEEQVQQQLEAGTLIEVTRDGVTEFHNVAMAAQMLGEEGYAPLEKRIEETKRAVEDQEQSNARLQARINMLMGVEDEFTHILEARGMTQEHLRNVMKASGETLESWKAQLTVGNDRLKQFQANVGGAVNALNNYRLAVIGAKEGGPVDFGQGIGPGTVPDRPDDTAQKEYEKRQERKAQMLQDLLRMEEDYQAELSAIGLEGIELNANQLEQTKAAIERHHDDLLADAKDLNLKKQIEESRANSLAMAQRIAIRQAEVEAEEVDAEYERAQYERKQQVLNQIAELAATERTDREATVIADHLGFVRDLEASGIVLTEEQKLRIHSAYLDKKLAATTGDLQARLRIEGRSATFEEKLNIKKLKSEIKTRAKILKNNQESGLKITSLRRKQSEIAEKLANATSEKEKERLEKKQQNLREQMDKEVEDTKKKNEQIIKNEERTFKIIQKIRKGAEDTGMDDVGKGIEKVLGLFPKLKKAIEDSKKDTPETPFGKFLKDAREAVGAVGAIGNAFVSMGKKAVSVFKSLSGFSFDPMAMADEAMGKKEELGDQAVEAENQRREDAGLEAMTADEEAVVREEAEAGFDPKAAAAEVAEQQAEAMRERLEMVLEMIPVFVEKLAESLPPLIAAFVDGFPDMVTALVEALSGPDGLMVVIAKAVPDLISTIIAAIPELIPPIIDGLVEFIANGIPQIVETLALAIPELIMGLAEGLPLLIEAIVAMIPQVLQSIIEMLPTLLESLIALVLNVVTSLLEQLPVLIVELVNQIPVLITALVDAIPLIIQQVVAALPRIITAIINAIPVIILGVIKAIPKIITALIQAIPTLLKALLVGLFEIIKAIFVELPGMLAEAIGKAFKEAWKGIKKAFKSLFESLNPANWFGDTPEAIKVGQQPQTFGFMPNDYVVAAQSPAVLFRQAADLMAKRGVPQLRRNDRRSTVAEMSSAPMVSMFGENPQASPAQRLMQNIRVEVEGETIDNALITARDRGSSPQIWNEIDRIAGGGASVGFERVDSE